MGNLTVYMGRFNQCGDKERVNRVAMKAEIVSRWRVISSQDGRRDLLALEQLSLKTVWAESLCMALDNFGCSGSSAAKLRSE